MVQQNRQRGRRELDKTHVDPALVPAVVGEEEEEGAGSLPKEKTLERSSSLLPEAEVSVGDSWYSNGLFLSLPPLSLTLSLTLSHSLSLTLTLPLSPSLPHSLSLSLSLSLSPPSLSPSLPQSSSSWDQVNMDIVGGRKFKWLRDRMGGISQSTQLLGQIKNFVLTEEVEVRFLHSTLRRQVRHTVITCLDLVSRIVSM